MIILYRSIQIDNIQRVLNSNNNFIITMAGKSFLMKLRTRVVAGADKENSKKAVSEIKKLERLEVKMEDVSDKMMEGIEEIEKIKIEETKKKHGEFSWIKGNITTLFLQDIVGAAFGAVFFVVTQEVWDISKKIGYINLFFIFLLSIFLGFSLVYFSRRRKLLSLRLHQTAILRTFEIYISSFIISIILIFIFDISVGFNILLFKEGIIISLPAVISAATADLLFY